MCISVSSNGIRSTRSRNAVEVLGRCDVRTMRPVEAGAEKERLIAMLLHHLHHRIGQDAVRVFLVRLGRSVVRHCRAEPHGLRREVGKERLLLRMIDPTRVHHPIPTRRIVEAVRADLPRNPVVIDLARTRRKISVLLESLRQRDHIGKRFAEVLIADRRRAWYPAIPVNSEEREGLHSEYWQYARSKRTPCRAMRSIFGVRTSGWP